MSRELNDKQIFLRKIAVWILRVLTGCVFILSGWAKCIDIQGFCIKTGEYLNAMGLEFPSEIVLMGATLLSVFEFVVGVCVASGSLRRLSVWCALGLMSVMLPLSVWLVVSDPVSDCGCFGDLLVLSNGATFAKNIVLTALLVVLLFINGEAPPLFSPGVQWLVIAVSCVYSLYIGWIGYQVQPLVDFRPYKEGTKLYSIEDEPEEEYIYSKDGVEKAFSLEMLPDSTWTYIRTEIPEYDGDNRITVSSGDGEDMTQEFAEIVNESPEMLLLVVSDPENQFLTRTHYLQDLHTYLENSGVGMYALVGGDQATYERWKKLTHPNFPSYMAEDTSLKILVRGISGLVFLKEGTIQWKRTLGSLNADFPYSDEPASEALDALSHKPYRRDIRVLSAVWFLSLALIFFLGRSPGMVASFARGFSPQKKFAEKKEK